MGALLPPHLSPWPFPNPVSPREALLVALYDPRHMGVYRCLPGLGPGEGISSTSHWPTQPLAHSPPPF